MDLKKLDKHILLCKKNLKSDLVICCATCPFEEEIVRNYHELGVLFVTKRINIKRKEFKNERDA